MGVNFHKISHILVFAGIFPAISIAVAYGFSKILPNPTFWVEALSPLGAYGLLFWLFNNYLWRLPLVNLIVESPNLGGRWKGKQISSYKVSGQNVEIEAVLEIEQTFSRIYVRAFYAKSKSESVVANFARLEGHDYLYYVYDNDPNSFKEGTMQKHRGLTKLEYIANSKKLVGSYFNTIGNSGEVEFKFETRELSSNF